MKLEHIRATIAENNGLLFDYDQDGMLVLDQSGCEILHLPSLQNDVSDPSYFERLQHFFSCSSHARQGNHPDLKYPRQISADIAVFSQNAETEMIIDMIQKQRDENPLVFRLFFETPPESFMRILAPLTEFLKANNERYPIAVQIYGQFEKIDDSEKEFISSNKISLYCTPKSIQLDSASKNAVTDLAEFGFKVPFVWYVTKNNIRIIPEIIDMAMAVNFNSGFSLPLIDECFFRQNGESPVQNEYLRLLIDLYSLYPYYDEVFYPLNHALTLCMTNPSMTNMADYFWDYKTHSLQQIQTSELVKNTQHFLLRAFLWQRWSVNMAFCNATTLLS